VSHDASDPPDRSHPFTDLWLDRPVARLHTGSTLRHLVTSDRCKKSRPAAVSLASILILVVISILPF
jgi:hypothetical protein